MQLEIETGNLLLLRISDQKIELVEGGREATLRNFQCLICFNPAIISVEAYPRSSCTP